MHTLLRLALEILHFRTFLKTYEDTDELISHFGDGHDTSPQSQDTVVSKAFDSYEKYLAETMSGQHGCTARFWLMYVDYECPNHQFD